MWCRWRVGGGLRVASYSVTLCVINFISALSVIKTRPPSLLSPYPSHQEVITQTQWNVPVAARKDITAKTKGRSQCCPWTENRLNNDDKNVYSLGMTVEVLCKCDHKLI